MIFKMENFCIFRKIAMYRLNLIIVSAFSSFTSLARILKSSKQAAACHAHHLISLPHQCISQQDLGFFRGINNRWNVFDHACLSTCH